MEINFTLKELRSKLKITQEEAAERIGVSLSTYQKYERPKNSIMPSTDVLIRICDMYKVSMDYLLGLEAVASKSDSEQVLELSEYIIKRILDFSPDQKLAALKKLKSVIESEF